MTKAKARQRAKDNAAQKTKKREDGADQPTQKTWPGQFGARGNAITSPSANASGKNHGGARRGAARSR